MEINKRVFIAESIAKLIRPINVSFIQSLNIFKRFLSCQEDWK